MMSEDTVHEEPCGLFAFDCVEDRGKMHYLAQTASKHQDTGVAVVIGRKTEDKVETHRAKNRVREAKLYHPDTLQTPRRTFSRRTPTGVENANTKRLLTASRRAYSVRLYWLGQTSQSDL
ncbi:unnamed protein product [Phytophthora fragariaefolia]|uniref:Unnamed protein product n=1 Tax=Phytophthora fragariaefolia TaxID=1490495 RepID=A0A9W6XJB2_9STRA|nr:unnamed protein product [Phytophthora fragariaefolia]